MQAKKVQLADAEEIRDSSKQKLEIDKVYFNTFVHDCQAKSVHWSKVTKYLTETILNLDSQREKLEPKLVEHKGILDSQLYNAKHLVDNMNKNKVLKQILIQGKDREMATLVDNLKDIDKATQNMKTDRAKHNRLAEEKVDTLADPQRQINALNTQVNDLQLTRPKNWERSQKKRTLLEKKFNQLDAMISTHPAMMQFTVDEQSEKFAPHGSETTSLRQLDETSLKGNVKERNAMIVEQDEKFYIKFAQFEQRQKDMDRNTMKTINVGTYQSKRKIVIRTPPENAAQCFDVART